MYPYSPLYGHPGDYMPGRTHRIHGLVLEITDEGHWDEADIAPSAGHATPYATDALYFPTSLPQSYDPRHAVYDDHASEYEQPEPMRDHVVASIPPLGGTPEVVEEPPTLPEYNDALMDSWFMERALSELARPEPMESMSFDQDITTHLGIETDLDPGTSLAPFGDPIEPSVTDGNLETLVDEEEVQGMDPFGLLASPNMFGFGPEPFG